MMPKLPDIMIQGADQLNLFDTPILLTREYAMTIEQRVLKRLIDIIFSIILIVVTAPFMIITAAAIKLYDKGPVLYKQVRCTRDMREFKILKFRSMRTDAEKDGIARLASKNDSRITFGRARKLYAAACTNDVEKFKKLYPEWSGRLADYDIAKIKSIHNENNGEYYLFVQLYRTS